MTGEGAVLTVRGEATRRVAPDAGVLTGSIVCIESSVAAAMAAAAAAQGRLTDDLAGLGGVPLTLETERSPLTWSAFSMSTQAESKYDARTNRQEETGRFIATVRLRVTARDLSRLKDLSSVLARHDALEIQRVYWEVDDENPGWSVVRRDAIHAAVRRAHDYAGALGASLVRVEQVADIGLLEEGAPTRSRGAEPMALASLAAPGRQDEADAPTLDPVPQELWAVIEARFRTSPARLTD
jgi:uncharacterized protein YggE